MGVVLLALGLASVVVAARFRGIPWTATLPVLVAVGITPTVLDAAVTGSRDASALLAGGGALVAALVWIRVSRHAWALALVGAGAVLLHPVNVLGVVAAGAYLVLRSPVERNLGRSAAVVAAAAMVGGGILAVLGSLLFELGGDAPFAPVDRGSVDLLDDALIGWMSTSFVIVLMSANVGMALRSERGEIAAPATAGLLALALGAGILWAAGQLATSGLIHLPVQYARSALPILGMVLADGLRGPVTRWGFGIGVAVWAAATVGETVGR